MKNSFKRFIKNARQHLRNERPGEIIAISIALCAAILTFYQAKINRTHNFLSVTPYLEIFVSTSDSNGARLAVDNVGLGPALVKGITIEKLNGKSIFDITAKEYLEYVSGESHREASDNLLIGNVYLPKVGSFIEEGTIATMIMPIGDVYDSLNDEQKRLVACTFKDYINISISYCSVYDASWKEGSETAITENAYAYERCTNYTSR